MINKPAEGKIFCRLAIWLTCSTDNRRGRRPAKIRARLLDTMGSVYCYPGKYSEAEPLLKEALELRRHIFSNDHTKTLDFIILAAKVKLGLGNGPGLFRDPQGYNHNCAGN